MLHPSLSPASSAALWPLCPALPGRAAPLSQEGGGGESTGPSEECVGLTSALIMVKVPAGLNRKPVFNWSLLATQPTELDSPGLKHAPPLVSLMTFRRWLRLSVSFIVKWGC